MVHQGVEERSFIQADNHRKVLLGGPGTTGNGWCGTNHPEVVKERGLTWLPHVIPTGDHIDACSRFDAHRPSRLGYMQGDSFDLQIIDIDMVCSTNNL